MRLWTYEDVAAFLAMSPSHIRRMVSKGLIPSIKIGGARRFDRAEVEEWIRTRRTESSDTEDS
jgi:excisionase family DNA binding protein